MPSVELSGDGFESYGHGHAYNLHSSFFLKINLKEEKMTKLFPTSSPLYVKQSSQTHVNKIFVLHSVYLCLLVCMFVLPL